MNSARAKITMCLLFFSTITTLMAQDELITRYTDSNEGKFFVSWGGNRETFSKSDIRFKGDNYDFTILDATAKDKGKGWHIDYINPKRLTIPQTNAKIKYYISDHYSVSIGLDHMKYVMERDRTRMVDGYIDLPEADSGSQYNGLYDNHAFLVSKDFLKFEHTDGLNYIYLEVARSDDFSSIFNIKNTDVLQLNIIEGVGAGVLYPKSNTTLLEKERYDEFHVAGYGVSLSAGLNFTFFKHFFIQTDLRGGFINMSDIRTTSNTKDSASQHFFFLQRVISFGGIFKL